MAPAELLKFYTIDKAIGVALKLNLRKINKRTHVSLCWVLLLQMVSHHLKVFQYLININKIFSRYRAELALTNLKPMDQSQIMM